MQKRHLSGHKCFARICFCWNFTFFFSFKKRDKNAIKEHPQQKRKKKNQNKTKTKTKKTTKKQDDWGVETFWIPLYITSMTSFKRFGIKSIKFVKFLASEYDQIMKLNRLGTKIPPFCFIILPE